MASREIQDGVQDGRQIRKSQFICNICIIGNVNQIYTSFCALSNTERIKSSRKCIFDEILGKFWLFKNNFGSLGSNFKTTSG